MTSAEVTSVDTSGNGVKAKVKSQSGEVTLEADILLSAIGIAANIEGIGLEEAGVKRIKARSLSINITRPTCKAFMDRRLCTGQALAHVASMEAIICVEAIAFAEKKFDTSLFRSTMAMCRAALTASRKLHL